MARLRTHVRHLDGLSLFVLQGGTDRLPLLILHGFGSCVLDWLSLAAAFSQDRLVVAYDRPGFGLSRVAVPLWRGRDPYAPSTQPAIALALLDALGIDRVAVLGHSMGARLAARLARYAPERVAALVLVAPAWHAPHAPRLARWLERSLVRHAGRRAIRLLAPLLFSLAQRRLWGDPARARRSPSATAAGIAGWDTELWRVTTATLRDPDTDTLAESPLVPVLVIVGERDRIVENGETERRWERWRMAGARGVLVRFERSGHLPHIEEGDRFVAVVRGFLEEVEHGAFAAR